MSAPAPLLCPSAPGAPGAQLLGVIDAGGRLAALAEPWIVDEEFAALAREGRSPGKRFRFADACLNTGCRQWQHGGCSIARGAAELDPGETIAPALRDCAIRQACRWFAQEGEAACRACPFVLTDTT